MGYYARGHGTLSLVEGTDIDAVREIVDKWDIGWETFDASADLLELSFDAKYRGVGDDLIQLIPFVKPGEYVQFVGEDDAVWRLCFPGPGGVGLDAKQAVFS